MRRAAGRLFSSSQWRDDGYEAADSRRHRQAVEQRSPQPPRASVTVDISIQSLHRSSHTL